MMAMAGWGGFARQQARSFLFWLCITFLIVSIGYAVMHNKAELPDTFAVDESCDLHSGACLARSENGKSIELSISPRGIPLLQPLEVMVKLDGMRASSVIVIFSGVDIDMGKLSYPLGTKDGSSFSGGASLSVCTQRKMTWQAVVVIESQGEHYTVPFLFVTEYRSKFNLI